MATIDARQGPSSRGCAESLCRGAGSIQNAAPSLQFISLAQGCRRADDEAIVAAGAPAAGQPSNHHARQEASMSDTMYPSTTRELADKRRELAPETEAAFQAFSQKVFADGALPAKVKQIIAVAVAHVTQCPYCIKGHTRAALRHGATDQELMEAIWVAAEMRAGGSYAHSVLAIEQMEKAGAAQKP
jgi:AhpD family alkylhydroperoxidase